MWQEIKNLSALGAFCMSSQRERLELITILYVCVCCEIDNLKLFGNMGNIEIRNDRSRFGCVDEWKQSKQSAEKRRDKRFLFIHVQCRHVRMERRREKRAKWSNKCRRPGQARGGVRGRSQSHDITLEINYRLVAGFSFVSRILRSTATTHKLCSRITD